jgi:hypothetical protein
VLFPPLATAAILSVTSADPSLAQPYVRQRHARFGRGLRSQLAAGAFCPMGQVCTASCDCAFVATTTLPTTRAADDLAPTTTTHVVARPPPPRPAWR